MAQAGCGLVGDAEPVRNASQVIGCPWWAQLVVFAYEAGPLTPGRP